MTQQLFLEISLGLKKKKTKKIKKYNPKAVEVKVKDECKKFPYCDFGINALKFKKIK